jgi:hypothetical protein
MASVFCLFEAELESIWIFSVPVAVKEQDFRLYDVDPD